MKYVQALCPSCPVWGNYWEISLQNANERDWSVCNREENMQNKSPGSCNQSSQGRGAMGAALSITHSAATLAPWCRSLSVPRLLNQQHWNQAGYKLEVGSRNWCTSVPQKTAEGNNLRETWKQTSCKDCDWRSCTLAAFCVLFPAPCDFFKSAQDTSRSPWELRFLWLETTGDQFTTE